MTRGSRRLLLVLAVVAALAAVGGYLWHETSLVLDAPQPQLVAESVDSLPRLPPSIVEAPVTYDIDTALDSLEAAVPLTYGDLEQKITSGKNKRVSFAFALRRSPFKVNVTGQTVMITADVEYSGRVWYRPPLGPEIRVSCGTDQELPPRATLTLESTASLTRDWGLRTESRVLALGAYSDSARDRCRLTFLQIDVTDRVLGETRKMLEANLAMFDRMVARWPVRPRFEKIWRDLQKPVWLADSVYMTINPSEARIGTIGARGRIAYANLRLVAQPRVMTGPRPRLALAPLPPLERANDVGRGARVLMDASFTYPVATVMLKKALVGRSIEQSGRRVIIRDVRLSGIGGGKVALGIRLAGDIRGRVFFTGTPGFDDATHQITVPDLDYDIGTVDVLVKGYEWLNDVRLRDFLRERARLPDSAVVRQLTDLAEKGINRDLPARGTKLSGRIKQAGVIAVHATREEIRVRALAEADLRLAIDRAPSIPRPPRAGGKPGDEEDVAVDPRR